MVIWLQHLPLHWLGGCPLPLLPLHVHPSWSYALGRRGQPSQIRGYHSSLVFIGWESRGALVCFCNICLVILYKYTCNTQGVSCKAADLPFLMIFWMQRNSHNSKYFTFGSSSLLPDCLSSVPKKCCFSRCIQVTCSCHLRWEILLCLNSDGSLNKRDI